ncbi:MAG: hypothetical protein OXC83_05510 [Chloroflexi bacterium]|nr:hypothetical protein [Chloroflexota bacterium]
MSTEVREPTARTPTDQEYREMRELLNRMRELKSELATVRTRIQLSDPVSVDDRIRRTDLEIELKRLLRKSDYFIFKFG